MCFYHMNKTIIVKNTEDKKGTVVQKPMDDKIRTIVSRIIFNRCETNPSV